MILKKYFYFAMLMLASVFVMPSCSEDDVIPAEDEEVEVDKPSEENGEVVVVPNPAGDDFYMFVNGEWHESLTNTDVTQGYITDVANLTMQRIGLERITSRKRKHYELSAMTLHQIHPQSEERYRKHNHIPNLTSLFLKKVHIYPP